jgi:hypothetical protein
LPRIGCGGGLSGDACRGYPRNTATFCGTPTGIADTLEKWFVEGAADGYNILPAYFPGAFADFVDLVVPELQHRGLLRRHYEGQTLRDHLGLPRVAAPARLRQAAGAE